MNTHPDQLPFAERLLQRVAQSRFFTFSLLLHIVIVVLAGGAVLVQRITPAEDFAPTDGLVKMDEPSPKPDSIELRHLWLQII